jgi:hypothetical protein
LSLLDINLRAFIMPPEDMPLSPPRHLPLSIADVKADKTPTTVWVN